MTNRVQAFEYKFAGMRKPDSFVVYPRSSSDDGSIIVQGARTIARIEGDGTGMLNFKGSNAKYFLHLLPIMGAQRVTFPVEFLRLVIENQTHSGDLIGASETTGPVYIA